MRVGFMAVIWKLKCNHLNGGERIVLTQKNSSHEPIKCELKGLAHFEFVSCGQALNKEFYMEVLWHHLRYAVP